jgi:hypothetical protein
MVKYLLKQMLIYFEKNICIDKNCSYFCRSVFIVLVFVKDRYESSGFWHLLGFVFFVKTLYIIVLYIESFYI